MDVQLARQYHKRLQELYKELEQQASATARKPIVERMQNINSPLYVVDSRSAQHIEEALSQLQHPQRPVVNAAHETIRKHLELMKHAIEEHTDKHFVLLGAERIYAKPVAGDELRSAVDRGRLFHENYTPWVNAFVIDPQVERMLLEIDMETLLPALERMGFRNPEAILFFRTKAIPDLVAPHESIPSLRIAKLRAGIPVTVIKHRII